MLLLIRMASDNFNLGGHILANVLVFDRLQQILFAFGGRLFFKKVVQRHLRGLAAAGGAWYDLYLVLVLLHRGVRAANGYGVEEIVTGDGTGH